jgi:methionyl-tRNA formyltransferase
MNEGIRVHTWRDNGIEYDSSLQLPLAAIDEDPFAYVRAHFDIGVVASFGVKLPPTLINAFPHPPVNIHPSLLPAYRGAAPIQRALMRGEHTTGITLLTLHPTTFDAGRILYSEAVTIDPDVTFPTLCRDLAVLGTLRLLDPVLRAYPAFVAAAREQPLHISPEIPRAPKIHRHDTVVQWKVWSASEVYNRYRALTPDPGLCTFFWHPTRPATVLLVKLTEIVSPRATSSPPPPPATPSPGQLVFLAPYLWVWTASNSWLALRKLQISGGRPLDALDFWHGYHPTAFITEDVVDNKPSVK